jgi:cytochrome c oxidase cbb3-type subunit III
VTAAISTDRGHGRFQVTLSPCHLVTLSLFLAAGCDWHFTREPPERPEPAEAVLNFDKLYGWHCAGCHGKDGKTGPAPPLNDPVFLAIVPDEELQMVVAAGREGTLMPAWAPKYAGPLTAKQAEVLAEGIKKRWSASEKPESEIPSYTAPEDKSGGDKVAGANVFATACAPCHGEQGKGSDKAGAVNDKAFLSLLSDQELRRLVITGRPDLGMPGYGPAAGRPADFKPLTSADVGNLVALLASWRGK